MSHRVVHFAASILITTLMVLAPSGLMAARVHPQRLGRATAGLVAGPAHVPNVGPPWPPTL
ncbi:MAG: hypothetical protein M0Z54_13695 [Thermaerobacter sp.]|nr:hypothetical protein [Thermaerobacter sp.]